MNTPSVSLNILYLLAHFLYFDFSMSVLHCANDSNHALII